MLGLEFDILSGQPSFGQTGRRVHGQTDAMSSFVFKDTLTEQIHVTACDYLAERTGLSKIRIKKAMNCGAVWVKRFRKKESRLRRATAKLNPGDRIALYYDEAILTLKPPPAKLVLDKTDYSIWCKPAGLMTQGARFGDHCSLEWFVAHYFQPARPVFIVHRLDREAIGLVLLAHHRRAAALFSEIWRQKQVRKLYRIWVRGNLIKADLPGRISFPLDGRDALTLFETLSYDRDENKTCVRVELVSGRRHQIRRHFNLIGFPVLGDPAYGKGNKHRQGLQLIADALAFTCPVTGVPQDIRIGPQGEINWDQP